MSPLFLLLVAGTALAVPLEESLPSLEGAKVFRLVAKTDDEISAILAYDGREGYDILRYAAPGDDLLIMVTADKAEAFGEFLLENNIENDIRAENVQDVVDAEALSQRVALASGADGNGRLSFTSYPNYNAIVEYLRQAAANRSDIATLIDFGPSGEGRVIYGLRISSGGTNKPIILIEGTMHAREWIVPTTVLYFINELIYNAANSGLFSAVDFYFIPVLNPDGYEFTHTDYRLWRKTRTVNPGSSCRGVDGNRNFDHEWRTIGASSNPCSETFAGHEPFSEAEARVIRDFVQANSDRIKLYINYHSYGNYFLYPWGHIRDPADNEPELRSLAQAADDAQATIRGTRYTIGSTSNVLYFVSGSSTDWTKALGGVNLSYCAELQGGGIFGFNPPASEIVPVARETFLGFKVFSEYVARTYGAQ